jgi:hypothetical protein
MLNYERKFIERYKWLRINSEAFKLPKILYINMQAFLNCVATRKAPIPRSASGKAGTSPKCTLRVQNYTVMPFHQVVNRELLAYN